jgi:hypothetical protein
MVIHHSLPEGKKKPPEPTAYVLVNLLTFIRPGQVTELRALEVDGRATYFGFFDFDHLPDMACAAIELEGRAKGVYFIPNPIKPELLARCPNRVRKARKGELTTDDDILSREWMLIDVDRKDNKGVPATDAERAAAREVIDSVHFYLLEGMEADADALVLADSGNGYHLPVRIRMDAADHRAVRAALHHLAQLFDTDAAAVDLSVFNPARIVKLYGTLARKGIPTVERPHRRSRILQALEPDAGQPLGLLGSEFVELMAELGRPELRKATSGKQGFARKYVPGRNEKAWAICRAAAYAKKFDAAVSGEYGHNVTFNKSSILVNGFMLSVKDALPILEEWNKGCKPPWRKRDLERKLEQAAAKECGPEGQDPGWLLYAPKPKKKAGEKAPARKERSYRYAS